MNGRLSMRRLLLAAAAAAEAAAAHGLPSGTVMEAVRIIYCESGSSWWPTCVHKSHMLVHMGKLVLLVRATPGPRHGHWVWPVAGQLTAAVATVAEAPALCWLCCSRTLMIGCTVPPLDVLWPLCARQCETPVLLLLNCCQASAHPGTALQIATFPWCVLRPSSRNWAVIAALLSCWTAVLMANLTRNTLRGVAPPSCERRGTERARCCAVVRL